MENLLKEIRQCTICEPYLPLGPRPVVQASTEARILVVGQAPGSAVHETGIPFNDPSGDRLRKWMGIEKTAFYDENLIALVPMGFCYPGRGKSGDLPPRKECADQWREQLLAKMTNIELTLVIGQYAMAYHLPETKTTLTETVRSWGIKNNSSVIPLPHPSPRNNIWLKKNPWFEETVLPRLKKQVHQILDKTN